MASRSGRTSVGSNVSEDLAEDVEDTLVDGGSRSAKLRNTADCTRGDQVNFWIMGDEDKDGQSDNMREEPKRLSQQMQTTIRLQ